MKKYIYLAATALLVAACSNDNEPAVNGEPVAAKVYASIYGSQSRASGTEWAEGDVIGVFTTSTGKTSYANVPYEYYTGSFVTQVDDIFFQDPAWVTFSAYYPFTGTMGTQPAVVEKTITAEDQKPENQPKIDFLFAKGATARAAEPRIHFTGDVAFRHCMSQITLTFIEGDDVSFPGKFTDYQLVSSLLSLKGTFNPVDGKATAIKTVGELPNGKIKMTLDGVTVTDKRYTAPPVILFPQELSTLNLYIGVDGVDYRVTLDLPDSALKAGCNYKWNVTVNKTELTVDEAEIVPWQDVAGGDVSAKM